MTQHILQNFILLVIVKQTVIYPYSTITMVFVIKICLEFHLSQIQEEQKFCSIRTPSLSNCRSPKLLNIGNRTNYGQYYRERLYQASRKNLKEYQTHVYRMAELSLLLFIGKFSSIHNSCISQYKCKYSDLHRKNYWMN